MPRPVKVTYRVSPTAAALAGAAAQFFASIAAAAVEARGMARIAVSGGTTPKGMFGMLANRDLPYFTQVPWDRLHLFFVDERCVPPTDVESNYRMTRLAMLDHVPLPAAQVYRMEGELDPAEAATRYEATIRNAFHIDGAEIPAFDLLLLGMGDDGHTASLFPHTDALREVKRIVVANHVPQKDTWRITLTWPVINHAREVAFLIEGAGKAQVLDDVLLGTYDPESKPSQLIRPASGWLTYLLDAPAAALLPHPWEAGKSEATRASETFCAATLEVS
jgi:6-phosphogluconolactonase